MHPQRVIDRAHDCGRRANRPGFASPFSAELRSFGKRLDVPDLNIRHFRRHRHHVIGKRAVKQISIIVIDAVFEEGTADPLNDTTAYLLIDQQRIDYATAILNDPMPQRRHESGLQVDFYQRALNTVGDTKGCLWCVVARCRKFRLRAGR